MVETALAILLLTGLVAPAAGQENERVALDAPPPETFAVELAFRTVTSTSKTGKAVPAVTLELGVGAEMDPVECLGEPVLARVETDEEGLGTAELRVPVEWKDDPAAHVWVRVETPGLRRKTSCYPLAEHGDGARALVVPRGNTVFGKLVTTAGAPVPDARIWLLREDKAHFDSARTNAKGHFRVHFLNTASYRLHARSGVAGPLCGTAHVGPLELDRRVAVEPFELVLRPARSIAGRVVDPAGKPVKGARVLAVPSGALEFPGARDCAGAERDGGLLGGGARTDTDGRFAIGALVPGQYDFYADLHPLGLPGDERVETLGADGYGAELGGGWYLGGPPRRVATLDVEADLPSLELVYPAHRLEVTVAGAGGAAVPLFTLDERGRVDRHHLQVLGVGREGWRDDVLWAGRVGNVLTCGLAPARDYTAIWNDRVHALVEHRFTTNAGGPWLTRLDLELEPSAGPARLVVRVLDPAGGELPPKVYVRSAASLRDLECAWGRAPGGGWSMELPAGRFELEATAEPSLGECVIPHPLPRAEYTPARTIVELAPAEERTVELRLGPAGHLDLEAITSPRGAKAAAEALCEDEQGYWDCAREEVRRALGGGFARLRRAPDESVDDLSFDTYVGTFGLPWIVPGWGARCLTPIPPGEWVLEVLDDQRALFRGEVTIVAGETTVLRW